jgi:hypothetical protein
VRALLALLESIADDRERLADLSLEDRRRLMIAAGRIARPDRDEARSVARALRKKEHVQKKSAIEAQLDSTGIRQLRAMPVFVTPEPSAPLLGAGEERDEEPDRLIEPRCCYVCKKRFETLHHFYDQLCPECGEFNFTKRTQRADLRGRTALVTGSRVKIGYQAAHQAAARGGARRRDDALSRRRRRALRARARLRRVARSASQVHGLDLRHTPSVERSRSTCSRRSMPRLDFIINNACQTVRRPRASTRTCSSARARAAEGALSLRRAAARSHDALRGAPSHAPRAARPARRDPRVGGLHDSLRRCRSSRSRPRTTLRRRRGRSSRRAARRGPAAGGPARDNSWRLRLHEVETVELLEVQLVNAVAPFVLNARLKAADAAQPRDRDKHIVNVSRDGRPVLPRALQDRQAPAHQHGQGRAQHDDAHQRRTTRATAST